MRVARRTMRGMKYLDATLLRVVVLYVILTCACRLKRSGLDQTALFSIEACALADPSSFNVTPLSTEQSWQDTLPRPQSSSCVLVAVDRLRYATYRERSTSTPWTYGPNHGIPTILFHMNTGFVRRDQLLDKGCRLKWFRKEQMG